MTGHTLATGRAATLIKLAFAAGANLSAAFIAFGLNTLVTQNMPNDEAGLFLLGFSILAVLSVFFRLGLDNVILRFLSAHGTDAFAQEKLNRGLLWIVTAVISATILGLALSEQIAIHIFNKPEFEPVLYWVLSVLLSWLILFFFLFTNQIQYRITSAAIFQKLSIFSLLTKGCRRILFRCSHVNVIVGIQLRTVKVMLLIVIVYPNVDAAYFYSEFSDYPAFEFKVIP